MSVMNIICTIIILLQVGFFPLQWLEPLRQFVRRVSNASPACLYVSLFVRDTVAAKWPAVTGSDLVHSKPFNSIILQYTPLHCTGYNHTSCRLNVCMDIDPNGSMTKVQRWNMQHGWESFLVNKKKIGDAFTFVTDCKSRCLSSLHMNTSVPTRH